MGEGGAVWFPPPFLQFKESPPRDDPHSEGGGNWPSSAQTKVALQHTLQTSGRAQKAGHGAGTTKPGRMFSSSPQNLIRGGNKRIQTACSSPGSLEGNKGTFVPKASIRMSWDMISPWPSEASGVPKHQVRRAAARPEWWLFVNWRHKQQQRPSHPLSLLLSLSCGVFLRLQQPHLR